MKLLNDIKIDYYINKGNRKGALVAISYRLCHYLYYHPNKIIFMLGTPVRKMRSILIKYIMGIEVPEQAFIGIGLTLWHGNGLIINPKTKIGNFVTLRHTTTIGNKNRNSECPSIGNNVDIGAHTIIIGDVTIGDNVVIGAGSIITKSIPNNTKAYGNPIKIVEYQVKTII